jgi:molybdopterin molybdotransferase
MPAGADSVAMQEDCEWNHDGGTVTIPAGLKPGANRRRLGEDVAAGDVILKTGTRLRPQDVAAIASTGAATIEVFSPLRVAVLSTGNELRMPGETLLPGQVYDSNRYLIASLFETLDLSVTTTGIVTDTQDAVLSALRDQAATHDVIVTTGGASRGEEDHVLAALDTLGRRHLWQLAVKPGRPMMFGQIDADGRDCVFLGLPGNPVAAMVCFLLYVRPLVHRLGGGKWQVPTRYPLSADFEIKSKKPDRREFLRGILQRDEGGQLAVRKFERDGSGIITSLREADGLIEIGEEVRCVDRGDIVDFIPFSEFGIG